MQDLTAGMLRKAALVKRQTLSQRELVVGNSWRLASSPASVTGPGAAVVRWGMLCLSLWVFLGVSLSLQLQCGWWFLQVPYRAGEFPSPRTSWGAGQLHRAALSHLASGKMHKCRAVPWSLEPIIQFLSDLCFLFASWWKRVGKILCADISDCIIFTFW